MAEIVLATELVPRVVELPVDGSATIDALLTALGFAPVTRRDLVVTLNGHELLPATWSRLKPKPAAAALLQVSRRPQGGSNGGVLKTVLSVLLVAAAVAVSGGALAPLGVGFAAGSWEAQLAAAAVLSLGNAGLDALFPTGVTNKAKPSELGSAGARTNVLRAGDYLPRILGTAKVWPPQVTKPIRYAIGDDEVIEVLYALAGRHQLSDLRLSNVPIDEVDGLTYQVVDWTSVAETQTLLDRYGAVKSLARELQWYNPAYGTSTGRLADQLEPSASVPGWDMFAFPDADEMRIRCQWPEGMAKRNDASSVCYQPMRLRVRAKGATAWINLPEVWWSNQNTTTAYRQDIILRRSEIGGPIVTPVIDGARTAVRLYAQVPGQGQSLYLSDGTTLNGGTGSPGAGMTPQTSGWQADAWFGSSAINANLATATANYSVHQEGVAFYLPTSLVPRGPIEVEIIFGVATGTGFNLDLYSNQHFAFEGAVTWDVFGYATDPARGYWYGPSGISDRTGRVVIAEICAMMIAPPAVNVSRANATLIALRGRNIQVGDLSAIATSVIHDRQSDDWLATDNPAKLSEALARGEATHRPVACGIDTVAYDAWAARCSAQNYRASLQVAGGRWDDVQKSLASAGYGGFATGRAWRPYYDRDRSGEVPTMAFGPANSRYVSLSRAWPAVTTDALRVTVRDRANDYVERSSLVYAAGVDAVSSRGLEDVQYPELADMSLAEARARYDLALARYRGARLVIETDHAAEAVEKGDLVMAIWDVLAELDAQHAVNERAAAQSAYIRAVTRNLSGQITAIELERPVYVEPSTGSVFAPTNLFAESNILAIGDPYVARVTVGRDLPGSGPAGYVLGFDLTVAAAGATTSLSIVPAAVPRADSVAPGQILTVGRMQRLSRRSIVEAITAQDGLFKLTLVPEAPEIWQ